MFLCNLSEMYRLEKTPKNIRNLIVYVIKCFPNIVILLNSEICASKLLLKVNAYTILFKYCKHVHEISLSLNRSP